MSILYFLGGGPRSICVKLMNIEDGKNGKTTIMNGLDIKWTGHKKPLVHVTHITIHV